MKLFIVTYLFTGCFILCAGQIRAQELHIRVQEVRPGKGPILAAVFDNEAGFPFNAAQAVLRLRSEPNKDGVELSTTALKQGRYAVALFQDANGDAQLNTNFLGIPREGYGVSNNAYNTFSAPRFADASFELKGKTVLHIKMHY